MPPERGDLLEHMGRRLRELRERRGLTQEQVGERAGYTAKYISEIERGRRDPPVTTLGRIAERGIGCDLGEILGRPRRARSRRDRTATGVAYAERALPPAVYALAEQIADLPGYHARAQVLAMVRSAIALARSK